MGKREGGEEMLPFIIGSLLLSFIIMVVKWVSQRGPRKAKRMKKKKYNKHIKELMDNSPPRRFYGIFHCGKCKIQWESNQTWLSERKSGKLKIFRQACGKCNTFYIPKKIEKKNEKEFGHKGVLCEMCRFLRFNCRKQNK